MVSFSWTLLPRDSRSSSNFQIAQSKYPDFFAKMLTRDHKGRPNFEVASTKLLYFWENFTS